MDNYVEQILKRKPQASQYGAVAGSFVLIAAGFVVMMFVRLNLGLLVFAVGCFLVFLTSKRLNSEYEYVFTNGDFDVSIIYNMTSRKEYYSFEKDKVLRVIPYNSPKFQNELEVSDVRIKNLTSGNRENDSLWYSFMLSDSKTGNTTAVIIELNDRSLEHVNAFYKNKIEE